MSISTLMVEWMSRLNKKGLIGPGMSILELGPQDVATRPSIVANVASRHVANAEDYVERIFKGVPEGQPAKGTQSNFYAIFGPSPYFSADYFDPHADFKIDLNVPGKSARKFSIVTNFGTSEHVFNTGASFINMHELLADGGIALLVLPTFGHIDHGFYNIHPTLYQDFATANNYSIEDFLYIDNFGVRNILYEKTGATSFDFDALPVKLAPRRHKSAYQIECDLAREVTLRFAENVMSAQTLEYGRELPPIVFDYCFVAMRKLPRPANQPCVIPSQGIYYT